MLRFRVEFKALFHLSDAESISLAESNTISAITASTPYSGRPIGVVKEITPVVLAILEAAELDTAELDTAALDTAAPDTAALDTAALDTILVSTSLYKPL